MPEHPYLSVVMTSRNDNHGGSMTERMRHCFRSLAEQVHRTRLPVELLLVDWNPPSDHPPLAEIEGFPKSTDLFTFRNITVPAELHRGFPHSGRVPLYQYIAKNVGIRRARAPFVLCSNVDVILPDATMDRLAERTLQAGLLYRADRWDVAFLDVPSDIPDTQRQAMAPDRLTRANLRFRTHSHSDFAGATDFAALCARVGELNRRNCQSAHAPSAWHTNACGDFTLMGASDWAALQGYPEWPIHSWHIDSVFLANARAKGIEEHYLGAGFPIFHVDHEVGWAGANFGGGSLAFALAEQEGAEQEGAGQEGKEWRIVPRRAALPILSNLDLERAETMIATHPDLVFQDSGWGLAGHSLPEIFR